MLGSSALLFGCTEDISCSCKHDNDLNHDPFVRRLCSECRVPFCYDCWMNLHRFKDSGTVPMSIANDHYYGYVHKYLIDNEVTWLECAASSVCWSTMLVYYLEVPYGHLMKDIMGAAQGRTEVRGNLFSFALPWEDIEKCCDAVLTDAKLPHDEETLALLVGVHIRGGSKDLAVHLKGLTMRVGVVSELIRILRASCYPGYREGVNAPEHVAQRLRERYTDVYGHAAFTPSAILEAANVR